LSPPEGQGAKHRLGDDGSSRDWFCHHDCWGDRQHKQIQQTTVDLKSQFDMQKAISMPTVYSEDEFGGLASSFNEMARVISRTTLARATHQSRSKPKKNCSVR